MFINFLTVTVFDKKGVRFGVLLGCVLTTIGLSLQCLINHGLVWGVLGHLVTAVAWPFLWNAPAAVTSKWMGSSYSERAVSTVIGTSTSFIGLCLGYYLPECYKLPVMKLGSKTIEPGKKILFNYVFLLIAGVSILVTILVACCLRDHRSDSSKQNENTGDRDD